MERCIRYQAAIIRDGYIALVKQRGEYDYFWWNVPGGGREANETEEQCIVREVKEETNLDVKVGYLLIDGPSHPHSPYQRFKTYLCTPIGGELKPDDSESYDVRWFDLSDEAQLKLEIVNNDTSYEMLRRIRQALG